MRTCFIISLILLACAAAGAQEQVPRITGQKDLSTDQGKPITILLTDLYVEEPTDESNGNNGGGNNGEDNDDGDDGDGNSDDNDDSNDDEDEEDDDDENNEDEDEDEDEDDKDRDDKKKNKGKKGKDKDKDKDKGKGDRRKKYPEGYTLEIFPGSSYTFLENTVTPHPSFTGVLIVSLRVKNATHASPKYDLQITVKPVVAPNVPPVITGHYPLSTAVDTPLAIKLSDLAVTDPDNQYPQGFSLAVQAGENYTITNGTTVVPGKGFTGSLSVPVVVNDGKSNSQPFQVKVVVNPISAPVSNTPPTITGQVPLTISLNQSLKIVLTHVLVTDPDNQFPDDFSLKVFPGEQYTVTNTTVTPLKDYSGELEVKVSVNDGSAESPVYELKVSVKAAINNKPKITGQTGIRIPLGQTLTIQLSHLVVDDPDNKYPDDFTLSVLPGSNYSLNGETVVPAAGFLGTLSVGVTVNDGNATSDPFDLELQVVANDRLEIVGQQNVNVPEDSSIALLHGHLVVNDPSNSYPAGYSLKVLAGENYNLKDNIVEPHRDFSGNLLVPVTLAKAGLETDPFLLLIVVQPVNDTPELLHMPADPVAVTNSGPWPVFPGTEVYDPDDDHLVFAEIAFETEGHSPGIDRLEYQPADSIHAVFDAESGVLFLVGRASVAKYSDIIRSIQYTYLTGTDSLATMNSKKITVEISDGKNTGTRYERLLAFETDVPLEIPTAFTPNNDSSNDTWKITSLKKVEKLNTFIRVYDKRGLMVFQGEGIDHEWDGHFNGSPLPSDVYFYTIEMNLSYRKVNFKGTVTILR